jgi:hypothetical protein
MYLASLASQVRQHSSPVAEAVEFLSVNPSTI